jgi:hypothetical protein
MTKIYWCLTLAAIVVVMSSFSCSKPVEETQAMRQQENGNVTVDFTNFPARTVWTLYPENGGREIRFDSDSMKLYHVNIPTNTKYRVHWKLVNITTDSKFIAKCQYGSKQELKLWETGLHMYYGQVIDGTYTFTKERK